MALPRPTRPEYSTTIPSTGKKIKYSPFTVKEEKVLILAAEGGDEDEITNAVINILKSCINTTGVDVETLALFDIEYLFLKTRAKSAGEKVSVLLTDPEDETFSTPVDILIDKIGVKKTEGHTNIVDISDDIKLQMKYPDISFFTSGIDVTNFQSSLDLMGRCVSSIIVDDEVINRTDMEEGEIVDWLEGLTKEQFDKITKFFETMPKLEHKVTAHNTKTDKDFSVTLRGLADFF